MTSHYRPVNAIRKKEWKATAEDNEKLLLNCIRHDGEVTNKTGLINTFNYPNAGNEGSFW